MKQRNQFPGVTLFLIAINLLMAIYVLFQPGELDVLGFRAKSPTPVAFLTSLFTHANTIHLMGNMVFLAAVGVAVEIATGWKRYLGVYFVSGFVGIIVYWVALRSAPEPPVLVGASGCIAGCATYYSIRYTKFRVPVAPKFSATVASITAVWLVLQFLGAIVKLGEPIHASGFLAHLGGAVAGLILGALFKAPDLGSKKIGHQVYEALNDLGPDAQVQHLLQHLKDHPDDLEMHLKLAGEYAELGEKALEIKTLQGVIFLVSGTQQQETVERLLKLGGLDALSSMRLRQLADKLEPELARQVLWTIVRKVPVDSQRPDAFLDLLGLLKKSDEKEFQLASDLFRADYAKHPIFEIAKQRGVLP